MVKIDLVNLNEKERPGLKRLKCLARRVSKQYLGAKYSRINIVFIDDREIKKMNRKYKGRDRTTDVLCFCYYDLTRTKFRPDKMLSDIFISSDTARKNSHFYGTSFEKEMSLYVTHGLLHAAGYTDRNAAERRRMERLQEKILKYGAKKVS